MEDNNSSKISNKMFANKIMESLRNIISIPESLSTPKKTVTKDDKYQEEEIHHSKIIIQNSPYINNQSYLELNINDPNISTIPVPINDKILNDSTSIIKEHSPNKNDSLDLNNSEEGHEENLLKKKSFRDPTTHARIILTEKHTLGNIKCEEIELNEDKFNIDIQEAINYAESIHPFKLVIEYCQKFKWPNPQIDTFPMKNELGEKLDPPLFKTTISVKNNTFRGESIGPQKRIAKKTAAMNVLKNMLEDTIVRDSMKIFVKSLISKKHVEEESAIKIKEVDDEDNEGSYQIKKEQLFMTPLTDEEEKLRVERTILEFRQNNPLVKLNFFKNKVKIPFSFIFNARGRFKNAIWTAIMYVGSEIFGVGEDRNIQIAKYKAGAQGLNKIKLVYGEDVLKTKEERKHATIQEIKEDIVPEQDKEIEGLYNSAGTIKEIMEFIEDLNKNCTDTSNLQRKFEIFCLNYERNLIPVTNDFNEIGKILTKVLYLNKSFSIYFNNPLIVGSFSNCCSSIKQKVIDILFIHNTATKDMKIAKDSLIKNFNICFNENISEPLINTVNKVDDLNYNIEVAFENKEYTFVLLIRHTENNKEFLDYLPNHEKSVKENCNNLLNFEILRRLLRNWRRKFNLWFLSPELIDWILVFNVKNAISDSLVKIFHKLSKDINSVFKPTDYIPPVILNEVNKLVPQNIEILKKVGSSCISYISEGKFLMIFQ